MFLHFFNKGKGSNSRFFSSKSLGSFMKTELIIFDKDGTLIDFNYMWLKWFKNISKVLVEQGGLSDSGVKKIEKILCYNDNTKTIDSTSPLCCSPMNRLYESFLNVYIDDTKTNINSKAERFKDLWFMPDPINDARSLTDLRNLFSCLHSQNIKIAVCTSDNRNETMKTLENFKVSEFISAVVCGDDSHLPPKPDPSQIHHICKLTKVDVSNTIMVGDTITDMEMGRMASVSLCVGIPFGAGSLDDLINSADVIIPSVDKFVSKFAT